MSELNSIDLSQYDPQGFIIENDKKNHIDFIEFIASQMLEAGVQVSLVYPEEPRNVTIEIIDRKPAQMSSKTLGVSHTQRRPMEWKKEENIITNTEETYKIMFFDNVLRVTIWEKSTLDAEKLAHLVETILIKKYHFFRKHVDNVIYEGRLNPGFSSAYNDRKLYSIPLIVKFRTSEMFYESNPVIREIKTDVDLT